MTTPLKDREEYIKHEVQLRVHDERFKMQDDRFLSIENKLNLLIGLVVGSVIIPVVLHIFKLV